MMDSIMSKIEIKGTLEDVLRISTFLENNYIKHTVIENIDNDFLQEMEESIDWPLA